MLALFGLLLDQNYSSFRITNVGTLVMLLKKKKKKKEARCPLLVTESSCCPECQTFWSKPYSSAIAFDRNILITLWWTLGYSSELLTLSPQKERIYLKNLNEK
jgi:hypothetical protein